MHMQIECIISKYYESRLIGCTKIKSILFDFDNSAPECLLYINLHISIARPTAQDKHDLRKIRLKTLVWLELYKTEISSHKCH
jgi:hypothetical protein